MTSLKYGHVELFDNILKRLSEDYYDAQDVDNILIDEYLDNLEMYPRLSKDIFIDIIVKLYLSGIYSPDQDFDKILLTSYFPIINQRTKDVSKIGDGVEFIRLCKELNDE